MSFDLASKAFNNSRSTWALLQCEHRARFDQCNGKFKRAENEMLKSSAHSLQVKKRELTSSR